MTPAPVWPLGIRALTWPPNMKRLSVQTTADSRGPRCRRKNDCRSLSPRGVRACSAESSASRVCHPVPRGVAVGSFVLSASATSPLVPLFARFASRTQRCRPRRPRHVFIIRGRHVTSVCPSVSVTFSAAASFTVSREKAFLMI